MTPKNPSYRIRKIAVGKSDEVALVVEKIIDSDAKEIVLSIPRFSRLAESLANFHLIGRESKLLRKKIIIESVDDKVVELANLAGMESLNPILSRSRRQFYDIVSARQSREDAAEEVIEKKKLVESVKRKHLKLPRLPSFKFKFGGKKVVWAGAVVGVLIVVILFAQTLPRAEITLAMVKTPWTYNDSVLAEKSVAADSAIVGIPSQIFNQSGALQLSFPATGKKTVQQKATGKITIYNAYSSDPQPLVAATRFLTPDGKIFRLTKSVTVTGAKISEGKIIPSTIEASVIADQAGEAYNIAPVNYFSIPGFQGTPKYQAFYGESKEPMTGGFIGEVAFPTDTDVKAGTAQISESIKKTLTGKIAEQIPKDFKIIDGANKFSMTKLDVSTQTDDKKNFMVSAEAQTSVIAFKEADLLAALKKRIENELKEDYVIKSFTIEYGKARADFAIGRLSFPIKFDAAISRTIDIEGLKDKVKGMVESDLRSLISALPEVKSAEISLWPFWVSLVPGAISRIKITVD